MASLSPEEIYALRECSHVLDSKYAQLCAQEQHGKNFEKSKAAISDAIQRFNQLIQNSEEELPSPPQGAVPRPPSPQAAPRPQVPPSPQAAPSPQVAVPRPSQVAVPRPPQGAASRPPQGAASRPPQGAASRPSQVAVPLPQGAASRPSQVAVPRPPRFAIPQNDNPVLFMEHFIIAPMLMLMALSSVPVRFSNDVVSGHYLPVLGDGNCGLRAFLTALAARAGRHLPFNPPGMLDWIMRLKYLMIQEIRKMLAEGTIHLSELLTIPENGRLATLDDYFALFLSDGYHITNNDFRVLASLFNLQIDVIRQNTNGNDDVQCFVRHGNVIDILVANHICILYQPGHFVPIIDINVHDSFSAVDYLHNAHHMGVSC
jgi:hypothetical protein